MRESKYVCYMPYAGKTLSTMNVSIGRGSSLTRDGDVLIFDAIPVCVYRSLIGKMHFAFDGDGCGLRRGDYIHAIAYAPRAKYCERFGFKSLQRFSDRELDILNCFWRCYLKPGSSLMFNDRFFRETTDVLSHIAKAVNITV